MAVATIYHNTRCSSSNHAVATAEELGVDVEVVQYLKTPPSAQVLASIIAKLDTAPSELVRRDNTWDRLGLSDADVATDAQIIDLLVAHPELLQRPLIVTADRASIGRPKERTAELLAPLAE